jgi:hypothetical protein
VDTDDESIRHRRAVPTYLDDVEDDRIHMGDLSVQNAQRQSRDQADLVDPHPIFGRWFFDAGALNDSPTHTWS